MKIAGIDISEHTYNKILQIIFIKRTKIDIPIHSLFYAIEKFANDIIIDL